MGLNRIIESTIVNPGINVMKGAATLKPDLMRRGVSESVRAVLSAPTSAVKGIMGWTASSLFKLLGLVKIPLPGVAH